MEGIRVNEDVFIPEAELRWRFSPSGGPGGQHANRTATRAEVRFDVGASRALEAHQKTLVVGALGPRLAGPDLVVAVDDTRSQARNRDLARERLGSLLADALIPAASRKKTRTPGSSRRKRSEAKKARSRQKELRKRPDYE